MYKRMTNNLKKDLIAVIPVKLVPFYLNPSQQFVEKSAKGIHSFMA